MPVPPPDNRQKAKRGEGENKRRKPQNRRAPVKRRAINGKIAVSCGDITDDVVGVFAVQCHFAGDGAHVLCKPRIRFGDGLILALHAPQSADGGFVIPPLGIVCKSRRVNATGKSRRCDKGGKGNKGDKSGATRADGDDKGGGKTLYRGIGGAALHGGNIITAPQSVIMAAMPQQSPILLTAADAVRKAGLLVRRRFYDPRDAAVKHKSGGELVTETDKDAEDSIRQTIWQTFPEHGFLGEESGMHGDADACWVADPLDGTTNFVHGFEGCAVSLAFCRGGRPVAAAVFDVFADACYTAEDGAGAFCEGRRLRVSSRSALSQSLLVASGRMSSGGFSLWPMLGRLGPSLRGVRRTGSTALDLAYLAAGRVEAVLSGPVRFWDVAAGWLLVREAGGLICDIGGAPEFAFAKPVPPFVAGNAKTFRRFLRELQTCAPDAAGE